MKHLKLYESVKPLKHVFTCEDVDQAVTFVTGIMRLAEDAEHDPSVLVERLKITVELFTHSENRVTDKDLDMMKEIRELFENVK